MTSSEVLESCLSVREGEGRVRTLLFTKKIQTLTVCMSVFWEVDVSIGCSVWILLGGLVACLVGFWCCFVLGGVEER